eukprot:7388861-Prymnesium_polylepis.1
MPSHTSESVCATRLFSLVSPGPRAVSPAAACAAVMRRDHDQGVGSEGCLRFIYTDYISEPVSVLRGAFDRWCAASAAAAGGDMEDARMADGTCPLALGPWLAHSSPHILVHG